MPRFSIHSWNDDRSVNEPWMYPGALPVVHRLMALRQTLIPFLYDLLLRHCRDYQPIVRPTWLDFPADPASWHECDEHLLGPDLLVAPVMEPGVDKRTLRLPAGADWIGVWDGIHRQGGARVDLPAPLDGPPPLFARAGSAMLVDLAKGGWRPDEPRRGFWLFPPTVGDIAAEALEDTGDGDAPVTSWTVRGHADAERIAITVRRDGPGAPETATVLLPRGEHRPITVDGGEPVVIGGRRGVTLTF
jgi:alpha-glucosidase